MSPRNLLILLVFAIAAGGRNDTAPPATATTITGTNVDTTTAFTLPGTATSATGTQPPETIAGTLPATTDSDRHLRTAANDRDDDGHAAAAVVGPDRIPGVRHGAAVPYNCSP